MNFGRSGPLRLLQRLNASTRAGTGFLRHLLVFNGICGIGIGIAVLLLHVFHTWLGWDLYVSNLVAIAVVTFWNFGMNLRFNWQSVQTGATRRPLGGHLVLLFVIPVLAPGPSYATATADSNVEEFKAFLQTPPPIESILWRRQNGNVVLGVSGKAARPSQPYVTYLGACDGDNFWIREITGPFQEMLKLGTNFSFFVGRARDTIWQVNGNAAIKSVLPEGLVSKEVYGALKNSVTNTNPVTIGVRMGDLMLRRALNLGIFSAEPGTLQFVGEKFRVRLTRGRNAEGELRIENARVSSIKYQIVGDNVYSIISYIYLEKPNIPPYIPTRITQKVYTKTDKFLRTAEDFELLALKVASSNLDLAYFLPDRLYVTDPAKPTAQIFFTNGAHFYLTPEGLKLMKEHSVEPAPASAKVFFLLMLSLAVLIVPFLIKLRKFPNNKQDGP